MKQTAIIALNKNELAYLIKILELTPSRFTLSEDNQKLNAILLAAIKEALLATD